MSAATTISNNSVTATNIVYYTSTYYYHYYYYFFEGDERLKYCIKTVNAWVCPSVAFLAVVANVIEMHVFRELNIGAIPKVYYITIALLDVLE